MGHLLADMESLTRTNPKRIRYLLWQGTKRRGYHTYMAVAVFPSCQAKLPRREYVCQGLTSEECIKSYKKYNGTHQGVNHLKYEHSRI
jgi:hypothetical protein